LKDDEKVILEIEKLTQIYFEDDWESSIKSKIEKYLDETFAKFDGCNR
jgi:hypothetical protein